ncbi:protein required for cyt b6 assembly [Haematococcus lacustris]
MHAAQRVWPRWSRNCPSAALLRARGARCWQHSASLHRTHRSPSVAVRAQPGGQLGDEEGLDVAVFRFTLGIKGFEDRFIPRVVGAVAAALMALNHLLGAQPAAAAQVRVEYLCLLLAAICVAVPEIEDRLKEVLPGRGRQRMAESVSGATNGLFLLPGLSKEVQQELAWASSTLIKNTNSCGVVVVDQGQAVLARGALGSPLVQPGQAQATLDAISKDLAAGGGVDTAAVLQPGGTKQQLYLADPQALARDPAVAQWATLPKGAQCLSLHRLPAAQRGDSRQPSFLIVFAERPRAFSDKERSWVDAVARKLGSRLEDRQ